MPLRGTLVKPKTEVDLVMFAVEGGDVLPEQPSPVVGEVLRVAHYGYARVWILMQEP